MDKKIKETNTKVVHVRDGFDVYIGRPNKSFPPPIFGDWEHHFGNPFIIRRDGSRKTVIKKYELWLRGKEYQVVEPYRREWILNNIPKLRGKRLGCFCSPQSCHGDVLVKLVNLSKITGFPSNRS